MALLAQVSTQNLIAKSGNLSSLNANDVTLNISASDLQLFGGNTISLSTLNSITLAAPQGVFFQKDDIDGTTIFISSATFAGPGGFGELTTDPTYTDLFWKGSKLNDQSGGGGGGAITSTNLFSTVEGLGQAGYISTSQLTSTIQGLSEAGYISTSQLTSTIQGLSQAGYLSSLIGFEASTGSIVTSSIFNSNSLSLTGETNVYISTNGIVYINTQNGIFVQKDDVNSSPIFISSIGFVGSGGFGELTADPTYTTLFWNSSSINTTLELISTTGGLQTNFIGQQGQFSTLFMGMSPGDAPFWDSNIPIGGGDPEPNPLNLDVYGSVRILKNLYIGSTTTKIGTGGVFTNLLSTGSAIISSLLIGNTYINETNLSGLVSTPFFENSLTSTIGGLSEAGYISSSQLASTIGGLSEAGYISSSQLASTIGGLSEAGYISSSQLASTISGLSQAGYISSSQLTSTVAGLGRAGYISSTQLFSTVAGLGIAGYISSSQLTSTVANLGRAGYISTTQLTSTVAGLGTAGYISSTRFLSSFQLSTGSIFASSISLLTATISTVATISSLNVNSLTIGTGLGWVNIGPIQTVALSTTQVNTFNLYSHSNFLSNVVVGASTFGQGNLTVLSTLTLSNAPNTQSAISFRNSVNGIIRGGGVSPSSVSVSWGDGTGWYFYLRGSEVTSRPVNVMSVLDLGRIGINCNVPGLFNLDVNSTLNVSGRATTNTLTVTTLATVGSLAFGIQNA